MSFSIKPLLNEGVFNGEDLAVLSCLAVYNNAREYLSRGGRKGGGRTVHKTSRQIGWDAIGKSVKSHEIDENARVVQDQQQRAERVPVNCLLRWV